MAEKKFDGFTASFDRALPSAQHLAFVCEKDSFKPFDAVVDPRHADLLAGCSGCDRPLDIEDPGTVQDRSENPKIVGVVFCPA